MLIGGPSPALVCAVTWNIYTFSDDNPPTVCISSLLLMLATGAVKLYFSEYKMITPLGVKGGLHCKITVFELIKTIFKDAGSLGPANNSDYLNHHDIYVITKGVVSFFV